MEALAVVILSIVGGCVGALVFFHFKTNATVSRLARNLETMNLPDLMDELNRSGRALSASLNTHRETARQLPDLVSRDVAEEVRKGVEPVQAELKNLTEETRGEMARVAEAFSKSHDQFASALLTLDADGHLGEWVASFREVSEPMRTASDAIERHYETAERLLDAAGKMIIQWSGQRQSVESAFSKFSSVVEQWAVDETTHFRDIEHRIMNRLEETAGTNALVAKSLSELQTAHTKMTATQEDFSETVNKAALKLGEILDMAGETQSRHLEIVRAQEQLQTQLKTLQTQFEENASALGDRMKDMADELEKMQGAFFTNAKKSFEMLTDQTEIFYQRHVASLDKVNALQEMSAERQTGIVDRQREITDKARTVLDNLPSGKMQLVVTGLLFFHVLLTALVAYGVLFK